MAVEALALGSFGIVSSNGCRVWSSVNNAIVEFPSLISQPMHKQWNKTMKQTMEKPHIFRIIKKTLNAVQIFQFNFAYRMRCSWNWDTKWIANQIYGNQQENSYCRYDFHFEIIFHFFALFCVQRNSSIIENWLLSLSVC